MKWEVNLQSESRDIILYHDNHMIIFQDSESSVVKQNFHLLLGIIFCICFSFP